MGNKGPNINGAIDTYKEKLIHAAPTDGHKYLPYVPADEDRFVSSVDGGAKDLSNSIDSRLDKLVTATFNYPSESVRSYDDHACDKGCVDTIQAPGGIVDNPFNKALTSYAEVVNNVKAIFDRYPDEQWVSKVKAAMETTGHVNLEEYAAATDEVKKTTDALVNSTNDTGATTFTAVRNAVKAARENNARMLAVDGVSGHYNYAHGNDWFGPTTFRVDENKLHDPSNVNMDAVEGNTSTAMNQMDGDIGAVTTALEAWNLPDAKGLPHQIKVPGLTDIVQDGKKPEEGDGKQGKIDEISKTDPAPGGSTPGGTPGTDTPGEEKPKEDDLEQKLKDLLAGSKDDSPSSPFGDQGGIPSGGMPSSGSGMPSGGMPSMGSGGSPFGGTPMEGMGGDPFADEPMEADGSELADEGLDGEEGLDDTNEDAVEGENPEGDEDGEGEPKDGLDAAVPVSQSDATVAADPESKEARTVTMPTGKQIEFPTGHQADMVRKMLEADPSNPKSLYMAASEAGYDLPPQGQDIGEKVPPSLMKEGDIISAADHKNGVYIGNGEVLMEDQSIKPLSEVANFDGENQGVFRMTEPDPHGPGLSGPAQTVSDVGGYSEPTGTVTAGDVQTGAPGMPTDNAPTANDTSSSLGSGTALNTGGGALDPNSAFPN